ncbi:MAG: YdcF family protein [Lachnospiraceae bacterium]|jgi:uncharacterized SAM-binding protein YcdF (DUF218 family)|nr:YdcF family protein [Lachnospiraceae bacterium]
MKNYLQTGCLVLGILCFLYYIAIGLYAGFQTSIVWIWLVGGGFCMFLWQLLLHQDRNPSATVRFVIGVMGALVAVGMVVIAVFGSRIVGAMSVKPESGLDYVVVLGAQVRGKAPSRALRRRLDRAVAYAQENPDSIFVLSGGQGPDEEISEAQCMYQYMMQKGIAAERLLLEDQSTSTEENLRFSDEKYELKNKKVGVVSNNFHIYRAVKFARAAGYQSVSGIPASADLGMQPHNILREICALLVDALH